MDIYSREIMGIYYGYIYIVWKQCGYTMDIYSMEIMWIYYVYI